MTVPKRRRANKGRVAAAPPPPKAEESVAAPPPFPVNAGDLELYKARLAEWEALPPELKSNPSRKPLPPGSRPPTPPLPPVADVGKLDLARLVDGAYALSLALRQLRDGDALPPAVLMAAVYCRLEMSRLGVWDAGTFIGRGPAAIALTDAVPRLRGAVFQLLADPQSRSNDWVRSLRDDSIPAVQHAAEVLRGHWATRPGNGAANSARVPNCDPPVTQAEAAALNGHAAKPPRPQTLGEQIQGLLARQTEPVSARALAKKLSRSIKTIHNAAAKLVNAGQARSVRGSEGGYLPA